MSRATWLCPNRTEAYRVTKAAMPFTLPRIDACWVVSDPASAQDGDFYVGWFKSSIAGPFKCKSGTSGG